jgi:hypothetical protein
LPVGRQGVSHNLVERGASIAVAERLDMNEDLLPAGNRRDKAKAFGIVPGCHFSFGAHCYVWKLVEIRDRPHFSDGLQQKADAYLPCLPRTCLKIHFSINQVSRVRLHCAFPAVKVPLLNRHIRHCERSEAIFQIHIQ